MLRLCLNRWICHLVSHSLFYPAPSTRLDDTFIITGTYFRKLREETEHRRLSEETEKLDRKNSTKESMMDMESFEDISGGGDVVAHERKPLSDNSSASPIDQLYNETIMVERIRSTLEEVGLSISMTTITTAVAFVLGCTSSIPGIRWLCLCKFLLVFGRLLTPPVRPYSSYAVILHCLFYFRCQLCRCL